MNPSATKERARHTVREVQTAQLMAELNRAEIKQRLAESRDQAGLTQPEMGDFLHVHMRSIQDYESAKNTRIPWDRLDEWATVTEVSKEWLLHGDEDKSSANMEERLERVEEMLGRALALLEQSAAAQR